MKRDLREDPDVAQYCCCYDAATGVEIKNVIWADDEAGEYGAYKADENGKIILGDGDLIIETHKLSIHLTDARMNGHSLNP